MTFTLKETEVGNSLVVQWLDSVLPLRETSVQSPVGEIRFYISHRAAKKKESCKRETLLKFSASLRIMILLLFFSNISALALRYTKFIESIKNFLFMRVKFVNIYCARN